MMRIQKITLSFTKFSDADFETKAKHILSSMTGNPAFSDPIPTLAAVQEAISSYSTALVAAAGLGKNNVAEKNKFRLQLEQLLYQLGMFVMFVANGDETILVSSGFTLAKEPAIQHLEAPGSVSLADGITAGELAASIEKPKGARGYLYQICSEAPTETTVWTSTPSSRSSYVFSNLQPARQYWVRVGVTGSGDQLAFSQVATRFVQ